MANNLAQIVIRPATAKDISEVYGSPPPRTMKAFAAVLGDVPVAVSGVYYYPDQVVAFSKILPQYTHLKAGLARGAIKVLNMLKQINVPILAIAEPGLPTAPDFLERCGFEYVMTNSQGRVYVWRKH
jgi:hypothetical protein